MATTVMTLPDTPSTATPMSTSSSNPISTSTTDPHGGRSFREAYGVLQQHAQTLREQDEPNIDDLLMIVTESVQAYQVCKARIDAVEAALKATLEGVSAGAPAPVAQPPAPSSGTHPQRLARSTPPSSPPAAGFDTMDDDIPF
jgi:exodeoxyribonuclease VII small subunit